MTEQPGEQREGGWRPDPMAAPVSSLRSWIVGDPRVWWPRESDVTRWLADHLDCLAPHLGVRHLEVIGREV
ncbi:hypothetical protein ACFFG9_45435, partial [Kutzneria buriramensis]|uniref:hypothetical protein n=1 Tax=Kutzneria buriramensis TaxID=1045776 RepID=UPI0035ED3391